MTRRLVVMPRVQDGLHGPILALARLGWLVVAVGTAALTVYGFLVRFSEPTNDVLSDAASKLGMENPNVVASFLLVAFALSAGAAGYIFFRCSRSSMALLLSLLMILLSASGTRSLVTIYDSRPDWDWAVLVIWGLTGIAFILTLFTFPSGVFIPRWTVLLVVGLTIMDLLIPRFLEDIFRLPEVPAGVSTARLTFSLVSFTFFCGMGILAQVYRYRNFSTPVERQQAKWVVYGLVWLALSVVVGAALPNLVSSGAPGWIGWTLVVVFIPNAVIVPTTILVAVFKNHLYDIDVVINRTLVYGALTAILAVVYVGIVFLLQTLLGPITRESDLAIAGSTLAVAALFRPMRSAVQGFIDRRFYRRKFDAARTLEDFSAGLRDQVELGALSDQLLAVVQNTMQPSQVSLWIRSGT